MVPVFNPILKAIILETHLRPKLPVSGPEKVRSFLKTEKETMTFPFLFHTTLTLLILIPSMVFYI
jgi:hypothetical protein